LNENLHVSGSSTVHNQEQPARKLSTILYGIYHFCVYSGNLLMMDRRTVRRMYSFIPNKFGNLYHLFGFIIRTLSNNNMSCFAAACREVYERHSCRNMAVSIKIKISVLE